MSDWFFSSWPTLAAVAAGTAAMYVSMLLAVRVAGRRTLTRLSAFDVITTIALGSLLATTAVSRDASYAQGVTAMLTLLVLQVGVGAARRRSDRVRRITDFTPIVILRDGEPELPGSPLGAQLTLGELRSELRRNGVFDMADAHLVVLEPGGAISVTTQPGNTVGDDVKKMASG